MKKIVSIIFLLSISLLSFSQTCFTGAVGMPNQLWTRACSTNVSQWIQTGTYITVGTDINVGGNANITGNISGTWTGGIISQSKGGTGYSSLAAGMSAAGFNSALMDTVNGVMTVTRAKDSIANLNTRISTKLSTTTASTTYQPIGSYITDTTGLLSKTLASLLYQSKGYYIGSSDTNLYGRKTYVIGLLSGYLQASWTGSSNIVTTGTILSGTWHGNAISDTYISSASTWNAKQNFIPTGTVAQYLRGDLSLSTFPTNLSSFTNGPGYIASNQTITLSGDVTGTGNTTITTTLASSGVIAGTYEFITVNSKGIVTGGYNSVTNSLSARTSGTAYQASSTIRTYDLDFTFTINIGAGILTASDGQLILETSANGTTGWTEYSRGQNTNGAIVGAKNSGTQQIVALNIPAGTYYRLTFTQNTGTATWTYNEGHEHLRR